MDESDASAPFVSKTGSEMDISGSWKTDRAEGTTTRRYQEKSKTEKRITVKIETDSRTFDIWGGNIDLNNMVESSRDRVDAHRITPSKRALTVKRLEYIKNSINSEKVKQERKNFNCLVRGFQTFCYYLGYLARPGAVLYTQEAAVHFSNILSERFKPALEHITQMNLDVAFGNRLENFQLPTLTECIMLWRVYISICSGAVEGISPGTPFSVDLIKQIADSGILIANEDDYIMALSFFDELFSFTELKYFLLYVKERIGAIHDKEKGPIGYVAKSPPTPALWTDRPFFTYENQNFPDYNQLDLRQIFRLAGSHKAKAKEVLKLFAEQVCHAYPQANLVLLTEQLIRLTLTEHAYEEYGSYRQVTGDPVGKGAVKLTSTGQIMPLREDNIKPKIAHSRVMKQVEVKSTDGRELLVSFTLNRSWFDEMILNTNGPSFDIPSRSDTAFSSTVMERALEYMNYDGMAERRVILPGMTLNKVLPKDSLSSSSSQGVENQNLTGKKRRKQYLHSSVYELPHIFKHLHLGKKIDKKLPPESPATTTTAPTPLQEQNFLPSVASSSLAQTAAGFILYPKTVVSPPPPEDPETTDKLQVPLPPPDLTVEDYLDCGVSTKLVYLSPTGEARELHNATPGNVFTDPASLFFERGLISRLKLELKSSFNEERYKRDKTRGPGGSIEKFSPLALEKKFVQKAASLYGNRLDYYSYYKKLEEGYADLMRNKLCEVETINLYN
jgi:hypothetical protein